MRMGVRRTSTFILRLWVLISLRRCAPIEAKIPSTSLLKESTLSDPKTYNLTILRYNNLQGDFQQRNRRQTDEGFPCEAPSTPIPNSIVDVISEGRNAIVRCLENHRTEFNMTSFRMDCINGIWILLDLPEGISQGNVRCSPSCHPPCQRGECLAKDDKTGTFCKCPEMYSGKACEIAGCRSFPVVNRIVLEWNEMQQDEAKGIVPPIIRTSEVTGKCYEGAFFKIPALSRYTKDKPPFSELKFKCDDGSWKVLIPSENVYTDFDKADCEYSCHPQCQNGGSCILSEDNEKSCQCMPGFTGSNCELKMCDYDVGLEDYTWDQPIPPSSRYTGHIWKECPAGYIHPSTGNRTYIETCEDGEWIRPVGTCEALCLPSCMNDGICILPNLCACPFGLSGSYCQIHSCLNAWSPTVKNAIYRTEVHRLNITCKRGYSYPSGDSSMVFDCLEGNWDFRTKKPQPCIPNCISTPCVNGGTCIWPSTCQCPDEFTGSQCEKEKCPLPPKYMHNAIGNLSNPEELIYTIECYKGYEMITHKSSLEVKCEEGIWQFPKGLQDGHFIDCRPVCTKPCFNGGRCAAPDLCRCPEGFTGSQCTKRYENTVEEATKCQFPFMYKRVWYYSCTTFGYHMPWCATNVSATGAMTQWSTCLADSYRAHVRLTVDGQLCHFPFRHMEQLHYTCTLHGSTEPWCATSVDENNEVIQNGTCAIHVIRARELILTTEGEECSQQYLPGEEKYQEMITEGDNYGLCYTKTAVSQLTAIETSVSIKKRVKSVLIDSGYTRNGLTKGGRSCQFPFTLGGEKFYGCVVTAHRPAWCLAEASDSYGAGILKSEECTDPSYLGTEIRELILTNALPNSTVTDGFNPIGSVPLITSLSGRRCIFPFKYFTEIHYGCIYKGATNPWCATKIDSHGNAIIRDACPKDWDTTNHMEHLVTLLAARKNISLSKSGLGCQPFEQDGQLVHGCVKEEGQLPWCAVAVNSRKEAVITDFCVEVGENNTGLITTTEFVDYIDTLFRIEHNFLDPSKREEYTLYSVNGFRCKPFMHDNTMQHGCVEEEGRRPWCATSVDDDSHPSEVDSCPYSWKYWRHILSVDPSFWSPYLAGVDVTMTESGQPCVFPFIHENKMYHHCVESKNRRPWCATAIDNDGVVLQQDVCRERVAGLLKSASGKTCLPFLQEGVLEGGCVKPPNASEWCAVRVDDLGLLLEEDLCSQDWDIAMTTGPILDGDTYSYGEVVPLQTVDGDKCVPFLYEDVIVRQCVETEGEEDQAWCATSTDEDGHFNNTGVCVEDWHEMIWSAGSEFQENITHVPDDYDFGFQEAKETGIGVSQKPNNKNITTIIINITREESQYGPAFSLMNPTVFKLMIYINTTANMSTAVPLYDYSNDTLDKVMLNELVLSISNRSGIEQGMVEELLSFIFMPIGSNFQIEIADHPELDPHLHDLLSNLTKELGVDHDTRDTHITIDIILDNKVMYILATELGIDPNFVMRALNIDAGPATNHTQVTDSSTTTAITSSPATSHAQVTDSSTTTAFTSSPATSHAQVTDSSTTTAFTSSPATSHAQVTDSSTTTAFTNSPATSHAQVTDSSTTTTFTSSPATSHTQVTDSSTTTAITSSPATSHAQVTDSSTTTAFTSSPATSHAQVTDSSTTTTFTSSPATSHTQVTDSSTTTAITSSPATSHAQVTDSSTTTAFTSSPATSHAQVTDSSTTTAFTSSPATSRTQVTDSSTTTAITSSPATSYTQVTDSSTATAFTSSPATSYTQVTDSSTTTAITSSPATSYTQVTDSSTATAFTSSPATSNIKVTDSSTTTAFTSSPATRNIKVTDSSTTTAFTSSPATSHSQVTDSSTTTAFTSDPEVSKAASNPETASILTESPMPNSSFQTLMTKEPETAQSSISIISTTPLTVTTKTLLHTPSTFEVDGVTIQKSTPFDSKSTTAFAFTTHTASKSATVQSSTPYISTTLKEDKNQTLSQTSRTSKELTTEGTISAMSELVTVQILTTQMTPDSKQETGQTLTSQEPTSFSAITTQAIPLTSKPVAMQNLTSQISTLLESVAARASTSQLPATSMSAMVQNVTSPFPITSEPVTSSDHGSGGLGPSLEGEVIDWEEAGMLPPDMDELPDYDAEPDIEITIPVTTTRSPVTGTTRIVIPEISSAERIEGQTTIEGLLCAFPFKYHGQIYDKCTSADAAAPWCPIRVNSRLRPIVTGYCSGYGDMPSEPSPKFLPMTLDNQMCQFPFMWKDVTYYWCTSAGSPSPWCATQLDELNQPLASGYCFDSLNGPVPSEPPPTIYQDEDLEKNKCVFPFVYKGKTYHNCTQEDSVISWCAYEVDSSKQPTKVGCCSGEPEKLKPVSGKKEERERRVTESGEVCLFPFLHQGEWHYTCIWTPGTDRPWCVTRYDRFGRALSSGYCLGDSLDHPMLGGGIQPPYVPSGGSNDYYMPSGGSPSYPMPDGGSGPYPILGGGPGPYIVPGVGPPAYPMPGGGLLGHYVQEGGSNDYYMPDGGPEGYPVPGGDPATYPLPGGIPPTNPLPGGDSAVYPVPGGGSAGEAALERPKTILTTRSKKCVFPFWYAGRWYSDCTDADHHKPWCAIAVNPRGVVISAEYCSLGDSLSTEADFSVNTLNVTENGIKCALPFLYGGKKFCQCTTEGDTRPWCATSIDEDRHVVTRGYCKVKIPGELDNEERRLRDQEGGPGVKEREPDGEAREPKDKDGGLKENEGGAIEEAERQNNEGDLKMSPNNKEKVSSDKEATSIKNEVEGKDKETGLNEMEWEPVEEETAINNKNEGPMYREGGPVDKEGRPVDKEGRPKYDDEGEPTNREGGSDNRWPIKDEEDLHVKEGLIDGESGLNKEAEWNNKEKGPNSNERLRKDDSSNEGLAATNILEPGANQVTVNYEKCLFPFHYKGIRYEHCACLDAPACWCATSLTLDMQPATSDYCRDFIFSSVPSIPSPALGEGATFTVSGCKCSLPFVYKGVTYTRCTTEDSTYPWCPTLVNEQRSPITTAYCRNDKYGDAPKRPPPGSDTQVSQIKKRSVNPAEERSYNDNWWPNQLWSYLPSIESYWP
ncbi:uncharacterized protein [Palaemon carinicauda]|uniref:uncharacterized protein isoform X3 n=1 Tax=Palaemon carinicauda TaxID=392227 RepID=UPI0035B5CAA3